MRADARRWVAAVKHPPFVVCVLLLTAATVSAGPVARWARVVLRKEAVPLRKPLTSLDRSALGEYAFAHATTLDPSTIDALGTDLYLDWEFVDTSIRRGSSPLSVVRVLITYYTGKPSLVPHVAEVCWQAAGAQMVESGNVTLDVAGAGGKAMQIPARAVTFAKSAVYDHDKPTVVYTFHCNGEFLSQRSQVRARLANPFFKGAYFCKIEMSFRSRRGTARSADRDEAIAAARKFFSRLLPVLLEEHLPDWAAFEQGTESAS